MEFRLKKEIEMLIKQPPSGISCYPRAESFKTLDASIIGVKGTPFEGGIFKVEIDIPDKYPFVPPRLKFVTKVYHPNIDEAGRVCLDMLKPLPVGSWKPSLTIEGLLVAVQCLLGEPNPSDPLMQDIANEYLLDREEYNRKAKSWTQVHAIEALRGTEVATCDSVKSVKRNFEAAENDHKFKKLCANSS